ncbi:hypothetical protein KFL_000250350 [Klebsormidium nitens]|uniref:Uncharacterized protein n=1 Tax=Klebsormidium nitens TaxID=105231 RepID=A0A1Y1HTJ7_KLENI|nr:hypothetical protein KFL_000250350 [Klebsormidium nitens]|eukprot:GAQ79158.1 hypothetical protein KFL_000250350 [Klebsormidium nitens]
MVEQTLLVASQSTEDDLRINSLALLNTLARCGLLSLTSFDKRGGHAIHRSGQDIKLLTEALKASLLSADVHAQLLACQLTTLLACDPSLVTEADIAPLVEADVDMFVYEVLRTTRPGAQAVSEDAILAAAIQALNALSRAGDPFRRHFVFGFEAVVHALASAVETSFAALQADVCALLSTAVETNPGSLPTASSEQLVCALASVLEQHLDGIQATSSHNEPLNPAVFACTCGSLASVLTWRSSLLTSEKTAEALTVALSILSAVDGRSEAEDYIRVAANLLAKAIGVVLSLNSGGIGEGEADVAALLINHCDVYLVPAYISCQEDALNSNVHIAAHEALSAALQLPVECAQLLAQKLAATMWIRLDFELLARMTSEATLRGAIFRFLAVLVGHVSGSEAGELINKVIVSLPHNAEGMLAALENSTGGTREDIALQEAVLALLHCGALYQENRIVDEVQLLASIERLLLSPAWQTTPGVSDSTIKHLLFLYSTTREASSAGGVRWNPRAERALVDLLDARGALPAAAHELPLPVIAWLFQQERLRDFCTSQIERWLIEAPDAGTGVLGLAAEVLAKTREAPLFVSSVVERLTSSCAFEPMGRLFQSMKQIASGSGEAGTALVRGGLIEKIRKLLLLRVRNVPVSILTGTFDLIGALLPNLARVAAHEAGEWGHLSQQVCKIFLDETRQPASPASLPLLLAGLNLLNRVLFDGLLQTPALREPAAALLGNAELRQFCENVILESARSQSKGARAQSSARDKLLLAALTFHHLWLYRSALEVPSFRLAASAPEPSAVSFGELLQILQSGPSAARAVASSCLVALISQMGDSGVQCGTDKERHGTPSPSGALTGPHLRVLAFLLHNLLSSDGGLLRRNGFRCLAGLCQAGSLPPGVSEVATHSPWNRFLAQEFVASVSAASDSAGTLPLEAAPLMTSFLRLSPRPKWLANVLSPQSCSKIVDWVCSAKQLSPDLIEFLCALREGGFLEADDVCKLQALFQASLPFVACNRKEAESNRG